MGGIVPEDLKRDPIWKKYFPQGLHADIVRYALGKDSASEQEILKLTEMDEKMLWETFRANAQEKQLIASIAEAENRQSAPPQEPQKKPSEKKNKKETDEPGKRVTVLVDERGLEAKIVLNKPEEEDTPLTKEDILEALKEYGVTYGIEEKFIDRLVERPIYQRRFRIARGEAPVDGQDGTLKYHFSINNSLAPKILEDGTADYKTLDAVESVKKGQVLCEMIAPQAGKNGCNVYGESMPCKEGKAVRINAGTNTYIDETTQCVYASSDGQASKRGNQIVVNQNLVLEGVNTSTGNILFAGMVQVNGDVLEGFTIHAGGDIVVKGTVEGAKLFSGGNIVLSKGMKGMEIGVLEARGMIRAGFIENAKVTAKKSIYADVLMNCRTKCEDSIILKGSIGGLVGGEAEAVNMVDVRQLGNKAHVTTRVLVQAAPKETHKLEGKGKIEALEAGMKKLENTVETVEKVEGKTYGLQILLVNILIARHTMRQMLEQLKNEGTDANAKTSQRQICVKDEVHSGVYMEIDGFKNYMSIGMDSCTAYVGTGEEQGELQLIRVPRYNGGAGGE